MSEVAVVTGEDDKGLVPSRSINEWNRIVVTRLIFQRCGEVDGFITIRSYNDRGWDELDGAKMRCYILLLIGVEHPSCNTIGSRATTRRKWRGTVQIPTPTGDDRGIAATV